MGNHLFVIFAVLDVSCAVNLCINRSFFTFITVITNRHTLKVIDSENEFVLILRTRKTTKPEVCIVLKTAN